MAIHSDTSSGLTKDEIKKILTNTFANQSKKDIESAGYDKTILGTIQCCVDSSLGQYKVKYQNGYLTAYSNDISLIYSNGTPVYVTIPESNFNNRLTISAIATSDSSAKTYTTFLEDSQRYEQYGPNLIVTQPNQIEMSSYAGELALDGTVGEKEYYLYRREVPLGTGSNLITLNDKYINYLKESGSLWLGASFKTSLEDSRKTSGDYGLIIGVRFKKDVNGGETEDNIVTRTYVLNTFNMVGNPFEFTTSISQYLISDIDSENIVDIDYIKTYVKGFPHSGSTARDTDIIVSSLFLYGANQLYDSNNDKYKIELVMPEGDTFEADTPEDSSLPITAILRVDGNPVTSTLAQGIQFWWAKKNIEVDSIGNKKYNYYTGQGWECLNTRNAEQLVQAQNIDDLREDPTTTVVTDEDESNVVYFTWKPDTTGTTTIKKQKCKSRLNTFKVVAWYNNTIIQREFEIKNENGIYLLIESIGGTQFYGGNGYTNLVAGAFRDLPSSPNAPQQITAGVKYTWTEIINERSRVLPPSNANEILSINPDWDKTQDNETKTDEEVNAYLSTDDALYCLNRYEYYTNKATSLTDEYNRTTEEERKQELENLIQICETRSQQTVSFRFDKIKHSYTQGFSNVLKWYITGNAIVPAIYNSTEKKNYTTAQIDTDNIVYNYYGTSGYDANVNNVLYQLSPSLITTSATYAVAATDENGEEIGYAEVRLVNDYMTSTRYSLKITNGEQVFVYNEAGYAPTSKRGSDNPRNIRPLFFKLYDNFATEGDGLIYDSENETSIDNQVSITSLQPKWRFYDNSNSLISTSYAGKPNCQALVDNPNIYELSNEAGFYYTLRESFNQNYIYQSNIELEVIYDEERVVVGTNFTFLKEGDLGTNGTGLNLDIYQPAYEAYRDGILTKFDKVTETDSLGNSKTYYYNPSQRHLSNIYLYATEHSPNNEKLVNLQFGKMGDGTYVQGAASVDLYGQWFNGSASEDIDSNSEWQIMTASDKSVQNSFWIHAEQTDLKDRNITLDVIYESETGGHWGYEPFERDTIVAETQQTIKVTANNIVRLKAYHEIAEQDNTQRVDYAYYAIPYFYYNAPNMEPNIDITNKFMVVNGFDTVVYDSTGTNPVYANQPFRFYLKDENGNDITSELSKPENASKVQIEWNCSKGFTKTSVQVDNYSTLADTTQLYNKYITYNNKHYHCTYRHTKPSDEKPVFTSAGVTYKTSTKTYMEDGVQKTEPFDSANTPILEYWEETNDTDVTVCTLRPYSSYESLVSENLFNSWISIKGTYRKSSQQVYTFAAFIPINVFCNRYGSSELNNWDGKSLKMDDELGYLIGNKVAAGKKSDDNSFTGITIGEVMYDKSSGKSNEVGLFGYGHYKEGNELAWGRTIFMDANSGRTLLGPNGSAQIALDPNDGAWSRLAGWYINKDYLYKPKLASGSDSLNINDFCQGNNSLNPPTNRQSIGLYCPQNGTTDDDDSKPFIWANGTKDRNGLDAKFYVTHAGKLYAQEAEIVGKISANEGRIGSSTTGIFINYEVPNDSGNNHYVLYNSAFRVQDKENGQSVNRVYMKGRIMADEGQFGETSDTANGYNSKVCFISYNWYPWKYPADDDPSWAKIDDTQPAETKYVFYHKNFHILPSGDVFMNGTLYAKKGRVGGWIIGDNYLKSVGYDGTSKGLKLSNDGTIQGPQWYINPDGTSSFGKEARFSNLCNSNGTTVMDSSGNLEIPAGCFMKIGNCKLFATTGGDGLTFDGKALFKENVSFDEEILFVGSTMHINDTGIVLNNNNYINASGEIKGASFKNTDESIVLSSGGNIKCTSIEVGGMTLEDYIKSVITGSFIRNQISANFTYPNGDYPAGTRQHVIISAPS